MIAALRRALFKLRNHDRLEQLLEDAWEHNLRGVTDLSRATQTQVAVQREVAAIRRRRIAN